MSLRSGLVSSKVPLLVRHYHRCRCVVVLSGSDTAVGPCRVVARAVRDPVTSRSVGSCYMTRAAQLLPSSDVRSIASLRARPRVDVARADTARDATYVTSYDRIRTAAGLARPGGPAAVIPVDRPRTTRVPRRPARRGRCISAPDTRRPLSLVVRGCVEMRTHKLEMRTRARGFVGPRSS